MSATPTGPSGPSVSSIAPAVLPVPAVVATVPAAQMLTAGQSETGGAGYPRFGDPVEGRDGALGTVAGTRPAGKGSELNYMLVRQSRAWSLRDLWSLGSLRHETRYVPLSWMQERQAGSDSVMLNASRAEVAGCPPVRADRHIRDDVEAALWPQGISASNPALQLSVQDGVVQLTGHTRSPRETMAVVGSVWRVPGVLGVRAEVANDEALTGEVAQALTADPATRAAHLLVNVSLGKVALDGLVPNRATHDIATALARAVPGVAGVSNGALIGAAPPSRPPTPSGALV